MHPEPFDAPQPFLDAAGGLLAAEPVLHERGELLGGANGALPGAEVLARATAELVGGDVVTAEADAQAGRVPDPTPGEHRFTPRELRGRGIASYVVGELTRRGLEAGHRMCLFTDRANPTSNKIYAGLGYEPVVDMAEHLVRVPANP